MLDKDTNDRDPLPHDNDDLRDQAIIGALRGIAEYRLAEIGDWRKTLPGTTPGVPYPVQYLDAARGFYYIVPFGDREAVPVAVVVDGPTGKYKESVTAPGPGVDVIVVKNTDSIFARLLKEGFDYQDKHIILKTDDILDPQPPLVWKRCLESASPFDPFYKITVRVEAEEVVLYVRAFDGYIYTELHDSTGGN